MNIDGWAPVWRQWASICAYLLFFMCLLASPYARAQDEQANNVSPISVPNPGTDLWRGVRHSSVGSTQVAGLEAGVLINPAGYQWQRLRTGPLLSFAGWAIFGVVLAIAVFYIARGPIRLEDGRSGRTVERWGMWRRVLHWYVAVLFVVLALTGLSILFGRTMILPIIGLEAFGSFLQVAKGVHNYAGPAFVVGVVLMLLAFARFNLPAMSDFVWLARAGGFFGKSHAPADTVNAGEKIFTYWMMATVGVLACGTGLILDFPNFQQTREVMQLNTMLHAIATVVWVFFALGHIFLGTAGVEGTFEGMWGGKVDVNWARQHHDLWYDRIKAQAGRRDDGQAEVDPDEEETVIRGQPS